MRKTILMVAVAAVFTFAGCQKEQTGKESKLNDVIHISVNQMGPATKVVADDITADPLTFKWENGDAVAFWEATPTFTKVKTYTCTDPEEGIFESADGNRLDPAGTYYVVYPEECDPLTILLQLSPLSYTYRGKELPKEHVMMGMGISGSAREFTLEGHSTILHFQLKGTSTIGSIEYETDGATSSILSCGKDGVLLDPAEPKDFYIDAPKRNSKGYSVIIKDPSGEILLTKSSDQDLATEYYVNKIIDFPVLEVPAESSN